MYMCVYIYIYMIKGYIYDMDTIYIQEPSFVTGFHMVSFECAHVATFCNMLSHVATCCHMLTHVTIFSHEVDYGETGHFCDDRICPDPVWKLSIG